MTSQERDSIVGVLSSLKAELDKLTPNEANSADLVQKINNEASSWFRTLTFKNQKGLEINRGVEWDQAVQKYFSKNFGGVFGLRILLSSFLEDTLAHLRRIPVTTIEAQGVVPDTMKEMLERHQKAKNQRDAQTKTYEEWRKKWKAWHKQRLLSLELYAEKLYQVANQGVNTQESSSFLPQPRAETSTTNNAQGAIPLSALVSHVVSQREKGVRRGNPHAFLQPSSVLDHLQSQRGSMLQASRPSSSQAALKEIERIIKLSDETSAVESVGSVGAAQTLNNDPIPSGSKTGDQTKTTIRHQMDLEATRQAQEYADSQFQIDELIKRFTSALPSSERSQTVRALSMLASQELTLDAALTKLEREGAGLGAQVGVDQTTSATIYEKPQKPQKTTATTLPVAGSIAATAPLFIALTEEMAYQNISIGTSAQDLSRLMRDINDALVKTKATPQQIQEFFQTGDVPGKFSQLLSSKNLLDIVRYKGIKTHLESRLGQLFSRHGVSMTIDEVRLFANQYINTLVGERVISVAVSAPQHHQTHIPLHTSGRPATPSTDTSLHATPNEFPAGFLSRLMSWLSGFSNARFISVLVGAGGRALASLQQSPTVSGLPTNMLSGANSLLSRARSGARFANFLSNRGAANLASRLALSSPPGRILLIAVAIIFALFTMGASPSKTYHVSLVSTGATVPKPPTNIASGSCPILGAHSILLPTYERAVVEPYSNGKEVGHGTEYYWTDIVQRPAYDFNIPDSFMFAGCNKPGDCEGYGRAIDVVASSGELAPVAVPYVCENTGSCVDPVIEWKVVHVFQTGSGEGKGVFLETQANGRRWKIYLLHIETNAQVGQKFYTTEGQNVVGYLSPNANPPHVHFEIVMDNAIVDPTPFCDGTINVPGGKFCEVPTSGACAVSNMQSAFGTEAERAAQICLAESGGVPDVINLNCDTGDYSVGLFQINLLGNDNIMPQGLRQAINSAGFPNNEKCFSALDLTTPTCEDTKVGYEELLNTCIEWLQKPQNNIEYARLFHAASGWSPWSTAAVCLPPGQQPPPDQLTGTAYMLRGSVENDNVVVSSSFEIATPGQTCSWSGSKGLAGAVNANFFKGDGSPVGWAGFGFGDSRDYGPGDSNATRTFVVTSETNNITGEAQDKASVVESTRVSNVANVKMTVSGVGFNESNQTKRPRSGLGISGSGELILVGLTDATEGQLQSFLQQNGATQMIQLDGGGSTEFCQGASPLIDSSRNIPVNIGLKSGTISTISL